MARTLKFLESYGNRLTKLWKVLSKYDKLPDHFHDLQTTLQTEFNLLKKATSKNIENLHDTINLQQTYTTSLCSHANAIYAKLAQLDKQIQTHCLYPHSPTDLVEINAPEYDSNIDGHTDNCQPYSHKCHHMPRALKKIQSQSLPILKSTSCFHRIPIGLNLSPNQFRILENTHYIRKLNNPGNNAKIAKDPN